MTSAESRRVYAVRVADAMWAIGLFLGPVLVSFCNDTVFVISPALFASGVVGAIGLRRRRSAARWIAACAAGSFAYAALFFVGVFVYFAHCPWL